MSNIKTLAAKAAALLDQELMSSGAFSLDQLMELAGLAVAQAIYKHYPPTQFHNILVLVGPGNNGGDGLVASRHLKLWGYSPTVYYPKRPQKDIYIRLLTQLKDLGVHQVYEWSYIKQEHGKSRFSVIIDSLFGFSFKPPVREPFVEVLQDLAHIETPIALVDVPSGWDVDQGPILDPTIKPAVLISLTAPKPCASKLSPDATHYLGGRFINNSIAKKYGIEDIVSLYEGDDMVVKL